MDQQQNTEGGAPPPPMHSHPNTARPEIPQPGGPSGPGQLPPKVANIRYTEKHKFLKPDGKPHNTMRDLGFTGVLDGKILWTWGDTLMGTEEHNMICAVDSVSFGSMSNPMTSTDVLAPGTNNVKNWIPCTDFESKDGGYSCYSFGGTNIIEYAPGQGLCYYLKNHRPGGVGKIWGAGVATVKFDNHGIPQATRFGDTMWCDTEPAWGDVGITYNAQEGIVYAYGHGPSHDKELGVRTYVCRVPAAQATDISKYEYWDGAARVWTDKRMGDGNNGSIPVTKENACFQWMSMNQSAPFWSNYFNKWMVLHGTCFGFSDIQCQTSDKLEGPWQDHGTVASTAPRNGEKDGFRYCHTAHPEFDPSGKTVLVTWTTNNTIPGVWIEWQ